MSLFLPPPLGVPLTLEKTVPGSVRLLNGDAVIAEGRHATPTVSLPSPPTLDQARDAARHFAGLDPAEHAFPTCFVCGPAHPDGLRVYPGPIDSGLACTWTPRSPDPVFVWAALDCPSGFACIPPGSASVLASMTAHVPGPVEAGREYVISAWKISTEGRKHRGASALFDADGGLVAYAEALWITLRARTS
ncbi:hypothetical protein OM076_05095 [Solirubrobacter ginsenosidimutans]|uniref:PaaI family thioesterase n=1 Tax=Solirubrobacter ginsenosidimutans TaxID=490573 RepID=A0A9X3S3L6_9ACTN|nr:hypothetical protein [Solirubrobacter ginsenosidimutans]MDA0159628.1 hypothetical protein [Solirubrobacter ginsenosidimutans]